MGLVNLLLGAIAAFLIATGLVKDANQDLANLKFNDSKEEVISEIDFERLKAVARELIKYPYVELKPHTSKELAALPYDRYKNIRFLTEKSLWRNEGSAFQIQYLPPGHLYNHAINLNELVGTKYKKIPYLNEYFDWSDVGKVKLKSEIGHTGFKIHYPINTDEHTDEFVVFQGASYFRVVSEGQVYGLSARGISINTGLPNAQEEFPVFKEFWIKKPGTFDSTIYIYALLDGKSITGAYEFEIKPGKVTKTKITAEIYLRRNVERLGIAPLTSMFWYGENSQIPQGQAYPEVHDSDGVQIKTENGETYWRPIDNPRKPHSQFIDLENPKGYGLIQRDKNFSSYEDTNMKYQLRPSAWIEPDISFGKGQLQLYRFPTNQDSDDNVTLIWIPSKLPNLGEPLHLSYTISWNDPEPENIGSVVATRTNISKDGDKQFLIDYKGGKLESFNDENLPTPVVEVSNETFEVSNISIQRIPESEKIRLSFQIPAKYANKTTELKAFIKDKNEIITETWISTWDKECQPVN